MRLLSLGVWALMANAMGCSAEKKSDMGDTATVARANDLGGMRDSSMSMAHSDTVAERANTDLAQFVAADSKSLKSLLPAHTRAVEDLVADCERMMREMKMTPPEKWKKANAEIQSDLKRMRGMTPSQLKAFVPEHRVHVEGILQMRQDMMKM